MSCKSLPVFLSYFFASATFFSMLVGCGNDDGLAPVSGIVTLDGKPIADAGVMFHPDAGGIPATGTTDTAGKFTLNTSGTEGATIGNNTVTVAKQVNVNPGAVVEEGTITEVKTLTPLKYLSPRTSDFKVEVKRGMEPVKIDMVSGKKASGQ